MVREVVTATAPDADECPTCGCPTKCAEGRYEQLQALLGEALRAIENEHTQPWHETCPTCETYERIHRAIYPADWS